MNQYLRLSNKLPITHQDQLSDCGHACLVMIANYYGHNLDLASLKECFPVSINGVTILDLMKIADSLKLKARAIRADLAQLKNITYPVIVHWNMNHFVVIKKFKNNHVIIHDPAVGARKISIKELSCSFTGIVLEIEKSTDFKEIHSTKKINPLILFKNIHGLKKSLINLLALSLVIEFLILINPVFIQYVTDEIAISSSINQLYLIATGFTLLILIHTFTEYIRSNFIIYLSSKMVDYFSSGVLNHLLNLPLGYFEKRHKGDILSRFHSLTEIQNKFTIDSINTLLDGLVIILALIVMSLYSLLLTFIVVLSLSTYLLLRTFSYQYIRKQTAISIDIHAKVNSRFLEILQHIMPVKIFAKENTLSRSWRNYFVESMNADIKIAKTNTIYNTASLLLFNLEHILVVCVGANLVVKNMFSIGMLVAYLAYRQMLVSKSTSFIHKIFEYRLISIQVQRISDILLEEPDQEDLYNLIEPQFIGKLQLKNISYTYPGNNKKLIEDLSLDVEQNEKIVITGPSGIGKTTLLKIMLGLMKPTSGTILLDDLDINFLGNRRFRSICSSVMQDDSLMSGSILDNITFLDNKIDINKVYEVAKIAQIHDEIQEMKMGYETLIGDMGSSLSGGQRQRVLLARALYKSPKLLFLDEATSHLDEKTEIKINDALKKLNITQIIIAHRQETIRMADRVIKL